MEILQNFRARVIVTDFHLPGSAARVLEGALRGGGLTEPFTAWRTPRRVALIGFDPCEAGELEDALSGESTRDPHRIDTFDLVLANLRPGTGAQSWLCQETPLDLNRPVLFVGSGEQLLEMDLLTRGGNHDFLLWPWEPEEAALRAHLLLSRISVRQAQIAVPKGRLSIVIVSDDMVSARLIGSALADFDMEGYIATSADEAADAIASLPAAAVIVDANADGAVDVLADTAFITSDRRLPVVLLAERHQEAAILRAFELGAHDFLMKPFNSMELVARLRKLMRKPLLAF